MTEKPTIKFVMPLYRKAGMSSEAFRDYYEQHHRKIGEKYLQGYVTKYMRRYAQPLAEARSEDFDVLLEMWFPDQETYMKCMQHLQTPEIAEEIRIDEEKLFDRSRKRGYLLTEVESEI